VETKLVGSKPGTKIVFTYTVTLYRVIMLQRINTLKYRYK